MKTELVKISEVKTNPNNPRTLKDDKFKKLVKSIQEFPQMLEIRPIVVNDEMVVLGGNMRLKACKEAGLKEIHIIKASNLTEDQQKQFIIKDNVGFGEWDWDMLANEWNAEELEEWGLDVWQQPAEVDYSLLDDDDETLDKDVEDLLKGVKKAIQIEFEQEHFEEAQKIIKFWRDKDAYLGGMIMEYLKAEKEKI